MSLPDGWFQGTNLVSPWRKQQQRVDALGEGCKARAAGAQRSGWVLRGSKGHIKQSALPAQSARHMLLRMCCC